MLALFHSHWHFAIRLHPCHALTPRLDIGVGGEGPGDGELQQLWYVTAQGREEWGENGGWQIPAVSERDRRALADHTHSAETARRCRIVLLALEGWSDAAIADHLGVSAGTVRRWTSQFSSNGIAGLLGAPASDLQRTGSPRRSTGGGCSQPARDEPRAGGPSGLRGSQVADSSAGGVQAAARGQSEHRFTPSSRGRRFRVEPPLVSDSMELIGVYVSPQAQVAGLLEVFEPQIGTGARPEHAADWTDTTSRTLSPVDVNGAIRWLPPSEPLTHQLADFLRQLRHSAPGRRVHVVTDNVAAWTWLRSARSRDVSLNLVVHLAVDPGEWRRIVDTWAWRPTEGDTFGDTIGRLRASGHRFSWG